MTKKKIGIQLPKQARDQTVEQRFSLELEALAPIAEIVEVRADSPEEFAAGVAEVDAIITSWGLRIDAQVIDDSGKAFLQIDPFIQLTNPPQPILNGQTWHFQAWHRDADALPDCNNNFTDATTVVFSD